MIPTNGGLSTTDVDPTYGVNGSGNGAAVLPAGWSAAQGVNYAPTNGNHGPTHSEDRMWKMFANNSGNGEFVAQEFRPTRKNPIESLEEAIYICDV